MRKEFVLRLALLLAALPLRADEPAVPILERIRSAFEARRYGEAVREADRLRAEESESPWGEEAEFLAGESLFFDERYEEAHLRFKRLLEERPATRYLSDVVRREHEIGSAFLNEGRTRKFWIFTVSGEGLGREILEDLVTRFPYETFSDDAQFSLGLYHFRIGEFEEAEDDFARLVEEFQESEYHKIAHYHWGLSILRQSAGVAYDQTPLEKGKEKLREYLKLDPDGVMAPDAREELSRVEEAQAANLIRIAEYYVAEGEAAAARIYLRAVIDEFGATSQALKARQREYELGGERE